MMPWVVTKAPKFLPLPLPEAIQPGQPPESTACVNGPRGEDDLLHTTKE